MNSLAQKGYSAVQVRTRDNRQIEYGLFEQVTSGLRSVSDPSRTAPSVWGMAIQRNLDLWSALGADLLHPQNALPDALKGQLLTLGEFVRRHSYSVLAGTADTSDLVVVNEAIMAGLASQPSGLGPKAGA